MRGSHLGCGSPKQKEHIFWTHENPALLAELRDYLHQTFNARYPEFRFHVEGNNLMVQAFLGTTQEEFTPWRYEPDITRMTIAASGFEAGWLCCAAQ